MAEATHWKGGKLPVGVAITSVEDEYRRVMGRGPGEDVPLGIEGTVGQARFRVRGNAVPVGLLARAGTQPPHGPRLAR